MIWDTYLSEYVMAYSTGGTSLHMAFSTDLVNWTADRNVLTPNAVDVTKAGLGIKYVNMVSTDALGTDQSAGRTLWLYYMNADYEVHRIWVAFDDETNLAVGAAVTVDTTPYGPAVPSNLTNEDLGTGYQPDIAYSSNANTAWAYVNLGSQQTFNEVRLQPAQYGYGFPDTFAIDGSNNASTWTSLAVYTGYPQPVGGDTQIFSVGSHTYQYVRVYASKLTNTGPNDGQFKFWLNQFEVFNDTEGIPSQPAPPTASAATYTASTGFGGTQGQNQWSYEALSLLNIQGKCPDYAWNPMLYDSGTSRWHYGSTYALIGNNWQVADAATAIDSGISTTCDDPAGGTMPQGLDTARVWRAPSTGSVHITGTVKKGDITGGDGVLVRIQINRTTIWPTSGGWQSIAYNDSTGFAIDQYVEVQPADRLYFIVNEHQNNSYDTVSWNPTIDYKPVAATYTASTGFGGTQGLNQWSYQYYNGSTYTNMTYSSGSQTWSDPGTLSIIGKNWQVADAGLDSVRVWTAPSSGVVTIQGWVKKGDITGGDGVNAKVMKNGTQIWPLGGSPQTVAFNDPYGYWVQITTSVTSGDKIQFLINDGASPNYDTTMWDPTVILH